MDVVKHKKTGKIYSAHQVQNMPFEKQQELKGLIICKECLQNAWFKKKAKDGKDPCFSAKHSEGCKMKTSNPSPASQQDRVSVNKMEADTKNLGLTLKNYFSNELNTEDDYHNDDFSKKGESQRVYDKEPTQTVKKNWTIKKILDCAINNNLEEQGVSLDLNGSKTPLEQVVFKWDTLTKRNTGRVGFYWGYLYSSDSNIWLNHDKTYPYNTFSIKLGEHIKNSLWLSIGNIQGKWKRGVPGIVLGELKMVKGTGKFYVEVNDITRLYINRLIYKSNI